jgi:hypothetical protein
VALYEFLTDRYKGNSGFLNNLFIAYVRVCDFKGQQKVALNMYKEFNHLPHYLWAVISTYMQVFDKYLAPYL